MVIEGKIDRKIIIKGFSAKEKL